MSSLDFNIPSSQSTLTVKALNFGLPSMRVPAAYFLEPVLPGYEGMTPPIYAFFIEHKASGKRLMFDLGLRKDEENLAPAIQQVLELWKSNGFGMTAETDVFERLRGGGVDPASVNTVIWSHSHLDHTGDMSKFPSTTELVVGPGMDLRAFPTTPESPLLETDFVPHHRGRKVTELALEDFTLNIGEYEALDYFSDGSLYILNSPGHQPGHIAALARVTPTTFVLLGGDSCHHPGQFRPSADLYRHFPCPGRILESLGDASLSSRTIPLLTVPSGQSAYADREISHKTITKLGKLDASPDILVLIAHDATAPGIIEEFPESVNDWKEKGWKEKLIWAFLEKDSPAFRFGKL
ncbi:beta-lactamase-like protein [Armillaria novae-zelandiae]|uniref:Beta-lactamase-like protein n=1 Tax=Armillaria novae-zelandiae TaxID=153914 RepID=A0AA39NJA9_9AGAR|nr:beta-lactamase-like protein [Armillaria novae-zelandiae]